MPALELLSAAVLPSVERRIASKAMEGATRRAMGLKGPAGWKIPVLAPEGFFRRVEQDIAAVKQMKPGLRKRVNEFFMHEGPTAVAYLPSEHGMRIGETINKATRNLPSEMRERAADLVSLDPGRATAALDAAKQQYSGVIHESKRLLNRLPPGQLSPEKLERNLHRANQFLDNAAAARTYVHENAVPLGVAAGATALAGGVTLAQPFRNGFEGG